MLDTPRRATQFRSHRVGLLDADLVAVELQLINGVRPARAFASLPTGRLPIVPASIETCARAFDSENTPALRVQAPSAGRRVIRRKRTRWRIEPA